MRIDCRIVALTVLLALNAAPAAEVLSTAQGGAIQLRYRLPNDVVLSLSRDYYRSRHEALRRYHATPLTGFALSSKGIAGVGFYYSHQRASHQRQHSFALRKGNATVALASGSGRSFLKTNHSVYPSLNPYFVHGGSLSDFNYKSLGINYQCATCAMPFGARLIGVQLRSAGVSTRRGLYLGLTGKHLGAGFLRAQRGRDRVGSGFDLSLRDASWRLFVNRISSTTGARLERLGISFSRRASTFSLSYENLENPLYRESDAQRISLRYQLALGETNKPGHPVVIPDEGAEQPFPEDAPDDTGDLPPQWPSAGVLIGGGAAVVGAVLLLSSGDKGSDNAIRLSAEDDAGLAALTLYNPPSVAMNLEYGGWVYRNADNTYAHTEAVIGDNDSVDIPESLLPPGTTRVASYHTHAAYDPLYDNQNFSNTDKGSALMFQVNSYLGTPRSCDSVNRVTSADRHEFDSGCAKKFLWETAEITGMFEVTGEVTVLGAIPN